VKSYIKINKTGTHYFLFGLEVSKEEYEKEFPPLKGTGFPSIQCWSKPMEMDSLAVHPDDVPAQMERDRKQGLMIDYTQDGCPLIHSENQKRQYMKAQNEKLHDRNSYY
jgi:hypothetical protein